MFESDRDQSPATQTDSVVMMRGIRLDSKQITVGIQTLDKSLLQLQEVSSANLSNNVNATTPCPFKITPKKNAYHRILVDDKSQPDTTLEKSPLSLAPDKSISASHPVNQLDVIMDTQWLSRGDLLNSQLPTNVAQISGQFFPTAKSLQGLEIQSSPVVKLVEDQGEAIEIKGSREHCILPPSLAGPYVQRNTMTKVEIEKGS